MMNFKVSNGDHHKIALLIDKLWAISTVRKYYGERMSLAMDITGCHANGCRLDLDRMISASDDDRQHLVHDVVGIREHLDRDTGQLRDHFLPRYAAVTVD